jgi:hypothetical protein
MKGITVMPKQEPTLAQLDASFVAARALANTSSIYGHLIPDDEIRHFVAVILETALNVAPPLPTK